MKEVTTFFRCDSSSQIGSGHVSRCLNLAKQLKKKEIESIFICLSLDGNVTQKIIDEGFKVQLLDFNPQNYSQNIDASQTIDILEKLGSSKKTWVVLDHYQLDETWESPVKNSVNKLICFDDLAEMKHHCDVILNHNAVDAIEFKNKYQLSNPKVKSFIIGEKFTLFDESIKSFREKRSVTSNFKYDVSLCFGGSDPEDNTKKVLEHLKDTTLKILCILGPAYDGRLSQDNSSKKIEIVKDPDNVFELLSSSRLSIGAGGVMSLERCGIGIPSAVFSIADNQIPMATYLNRKGCVKYFGTISTLQNIDFKEEIEQLLKDEDKLYSMSESCLKTFDLKGNERVIEAITS